jgi:hypothetical protein
LDKAFDDLQKGYLYKIKFHTKPQSPSLYKSAFNRDFGRYLSSVIEEEVEDSRKL